MFAPGIVKCYTQLLSAANSLLGGRGDLGGFCSFSTADLIQSRRMPTSPGYRRLRMASKIRAVTE
jgi:hypothetical protein